MYVIKIFKIIYEGMTFKVAPPSQVFQCLLSKIAIHLDVPGNQKFLDEQKLIFRKSFMN